MTNILARYVFSLAVVLFIFSTGVHAADRVSEPKLLGILEDVPGGLAGSQPSFHVRAVFQKKGADWEAFPANCPDQQCLRTVPSQYPDEITWNITFDGRTLGKVKSRTPRSFSSYSYVGLQDIINTSAIPSIGERSREFAGWPEKPVYRPLVAMTLPHFKDSESWKPQDLSNEDIQLLLRQFRKRFPRLCITSRQDETKLVPLSYRNRDVVVARAYSSKRGWTIARLRLSKAIECGDTGRGWEMNDQWFALSPEKNAQYLDDGIVLVDTGDYDGSGKDALVFAIDRYNEGGYELFYDDFQKHAVFSFTYH